MTKSSLYIKCLSSNGRPMHSFQDRAGKIEWDLPRDGQPGQWKVAAGEREIVAHTNGIHVATLSHLLNWITPWIYWAEVAGQQDCNTRGCVAAEKVRLVERIDYTLQDLIGVATDAAEMCTGVFKVLNFTTEGYELVEGLPRILEDFRKIHTVFLCNQKLAQSSIQQWGYFKARRHVGGQVFDFNLSLRSQRGRHFADAIRSEEYRYNSQAAMEALTGIGLLSELLKEDSRLTSNKVMVFQRILYHLSACLEAMANDFSLGCDLDDWSYASPEYLAFMKELPRDVDVSAGPRQSRNFASQVCWGFYRHFNNMLLDKIGLGKHKSPVGKMEEWEYFPTPAKGVR